MRVPPRVSQPAQPALSDAPTGSDDQPGPAEERPVTDAADRLKQHASELVDYAGYYLSAKWDGVTTSLRRQVWRSAIGVLTAVVGAGFLIAATVTLLGGVADGLGILFGNRPWLGRIAAGATVLCGAAIALHLGAWRARARRHEAIVSKYEARKQRQRKRYGCDVEKHRSEAVEP